MTKSTTKNKQEDEYLLIRRIEQGNLVLLALLVFIGGPLVSWRFAGSAFVGSVLASGSFFFLKRTILGLVNRIGMQKPTAGFAMKFYLRLLMLTLVLTALSISVQMHLLGLILGLSTVIVSIVTVGLGRSLKEFSENHAKGA
jgi:hypothetical protein